MPPSSVTISVSPLGKRADLAAVVEGDPSKSVNVTINFQPGAIASGGSVNVIGRNTTSVTTQGVTNVTIQTGGGPVTAQVPAGYNVGGTAVELIVLDTAGKPLVKFDKPVTLTFPYTDADLAKTGGDPSKLTMGYIESGSNNVVICVNRVVDPKNKTITYQSDHASLWVVLAGTQSLPNAGDDTSFVLPFLLLVAMTLLVAGIITRRRFAEKK